MSSTRHLLSPKQDIERKIYNRRVSKTLASDNLDVGEFPSFCDYNGDLFMWAYEKIGDIKGHSLLEIGCGDGEISVWFAKNGGTVSGVDISEESIKFAEERARLNGVADSTHFYFAPAENLPLLDNSVDFIFINVALHHFELKETLAEMDRVLKPGGSVITIEPLTQSRAAQKFRESALVKKMYPFRVTTPTERMLGMEDLKLINTYIHVKDIGSFRIIYPFIYFQKPLFYLASNTMYFWKKDGETRRRYFNSFLQKVDQSLLRTLPFLKKFARFSVIQLAKE